MNKNILDEIKHQDYSLISETIEKFLADQIKKTKTSGLILGLSGGIDSAVLAFLCQKIMKEKTLALIMPDTEITPESETTDGLKVVSLTGINYKLIDINPIVNQYSHYLEPSERAKGNLRARIRTNIIYYYANLKNFLVLGSSDKSENLIGYFTKYGDGASDLTPIISLYKIQVRELAKFLKVPDNIIQKKSSPHLWKGHEAEKEIGMSYEEIDSILFCIFDKKLSIKDTAKTLEIEIRKVEKIHDAFIISEHKRALPQKPFME